MKVYIAGPMRGYDEFNFPAFDVAAATWRSLGHEVFSPADNDRKHLGADFGKGVKVADTYNYTGGGKFSLRKALGDDLAWICAEAGAIALLPGWKHSKGAMAEYHTALALGLQMFHQTDTGWMRYEPE